MFAASVSTTAFKVGMLNSGSTVLVGNLTLGALDAAAGDENISFAITSNAKVLELDANAVDHAGGAAGSTYEFTYYGANTVFVEAHGLITTGTPGPAADASLTAGIS